MNIWSYIAFLFLGFIGGMIIESLILRSKINNATIEINRPKMKKNIDSNQDFNSMIQGEQKKSWWQKRQEKKAIKKQNKLSNKNRKK